MALSLIAQRELLGIIREVGETCNAEGLAEQQIKDSGKMPEQRKVYTIQQSTLDQVGR